MAYYLCKVSLMEEGSSKTTKTQILVEETGVTEAEAKIHQHFSGSIMSYEVTDVSKTRIESVLKLHEELEHV